MKRTHYDLIIAWANGSDIQFRRDETEDWEDVKAPGWYDHYQYRVKPTAFMIGDMGVPEPIKSPLNIGDTYYIACVGMVIPATWNDNEIDHKSLKNNLIHLEFSEAEIHSQAFVKYYNNLYNKEKSDKPEWKDIPVYINWIAQDADGDWYGYDEKPEKRGNYWYGYHLSKSYYLKESDPNEEWYNTLEQRPEGI